ncbi:hypothetical protein EMCRGX_G022682 [Ephydatia muelleri]
MYQTSPFRKIALLFNLHRTLSTVWIVVLEWHLFKGTPHPFHILSASNSDRIDKVEKVVHSLTCDTHGSSAIRPRGGSMDTAVLEKTAIILSYSASVTPCCSRCHLAQEKNG